MKFTQKIKNTHTVFNLNDKQIQCPQSNILAIVLLKK